MTDKVILSNLVNLTNQTTAVNTINANNAAITAGFDNTLSRDGTQPNTMGSNLDMNNNQILNLPAPSTSSSPVRLQDIGVITPANISITSGTGAPVASATQGSLYIRIDGNSSSTRMYINTNGSTGWTNIVTAT